MIESESTPAALDRLEATERELSAIRAQRDDWEGHAKRFEAELKAANRDLGLQREHWNDAEKKLEAAEQRVKELTNALGLLVAALDLDRIEVVCEGKHVFKARQRANAVLADASEGKDSGKTTTPDAVNRAEVGAPSSDVAPVVAASPLQDFISVLRQSASPADAEARMRDFVAEGRHKPADPAPPVESPTDLKIGNIVWYGGQRSRVGATQGYAGFLTKVLLRPEPFEGWIDVPELRKATQAEAKPAELPADLLTRSELAKACLRAAEVIAMQQEGATVHGPSSFALTVLARELSKAGRP